MTHKEAAHNLLRQLSEAQTTKMYSVWTGPCCVAIVADRLRRAGFDVQTEGTERVWVRGPIEHDLIENMFQRSLERAASVWGEED